MTEWREALKEKYTFPALENYLASSSTTSVLSADYMPGLSRTPSIPLDGTASDYKIGNTNKSIPKTAATGGGAAAGGKKKVGASRESNGVRALRKASTRGMSPLTSFFAKKSPTPTSAMRSESETPAGSE